MCRTLINKRQKRFHRKQCEGLWTTIKRNAKKQEQHVQGREIAQELADRKLVQLQETAIYKGTRNWRLVTWTPTAITSATDKTRQQVTSSTRSCAAKAFKWIHLIENIQLCSVDWSTNLCSLQQSSHHTQAYQSGPRSWAQNLWRPHTFLQHTQSHNLPMMILKNSL